MVGGTNISQFRTLLNDATPEDLVTIAPLLFSRIGTLDQSQQDRSGYNPPPGVPVGSQLQNITEDLTNGQQRKNSIDDLCNPIEREE